MGRNRPHLGCWTKRVLLKLEGHGSSVVAAAFSPDGGQIVTGSNDNTARIWDAATGNLVITLEVPGDGKFPRRSAPTALASSRRPSTRQPEFWTRKQARSSSAFEAW